MPRLDARLASPSFVWRFGSTYRHNAYMAWKAQVESTWTAQNSVGFEAPAGLAVDCVVVTIRDAELMALGVTRPEGSLALPGGFVGPEERPQKTAVRKLAEKTGLKDVYLEQLGAFADPGRDPRGWIPSIAYLALVPASTEPLDPAAKWFRARGRHRLAFDHNAILRAAIDRLEGKLWWSNVAVGVLPDAFALSDARRVYEAIAGRRYDPATFARDLKGTGLIEPVGERVQPAVGRPASLYRFSSRRPAWGAGRRKRVGVDG
jgi:8-oxo-dGTP diphosphatase